MKLNSRLSLPFLSYLGYEVFSSCQVEIDICHNTFDLFAILIGNEYPYFDISQPTLKPCTGFIQSVILRLGAMAFLVNINGELVEPEKARVSVLDRGFLYGDSVYEVVRTYEGRPFALSEHLDRLERSALRLAIRLPRRSWIEREIRRTISEAKNLESYCRIIITRGSGPITLDPTVAVDPLTIILIKEFEPFPRWMYKRGIKIVIPLIRRNHPSALDPAIKSGNYLNSVLALGEAKRSGFDDALMLDVQGRVTEATSANVFAWSGGILRTPALETGILQGVTRGFVLGIAGEQGIHFAECDLLPDDLVGSDEVMLTSTLREIMPVVRVGKTKIGNGMPGPLAIKLLSLFRKYALDRVCTEESKQ